jgi:predicted transposase YbfD/YdcC
MKMESNIEINVEGLVNSFSSLPDARVKGRCNFRLVEVIFIAVCAVICGAKHWNEIEEFGKERITWLKKYLPSLEKIPSHQTFCRIFSLIPAEDLMRCFTNWCVSTHGIQQYDVIAIDGKTLRKSGNANKNQKPLHLINAYVTEHGITLGSIKTPDKTNEIKGIPPLLKSLHIAGCIITIDAMGTQKGIANLIRLRGAHYILALKKNHGRFYRKVNNDFIRANELNYQGMVYQENTTSDYDHSRYEKREYKILPAMYFLFEKGVWKDLQTIIQVRSIRETTNGREENIRYYISSLPLKDYLLITKGIRSHWGIENSLHWKLDVAMQEDACRIHDPVAAENFSTLRKLVLQILEKDKSVKGGIAFKQWKAALNTKYLEKLLIF